MLKALDERLEEWMNMWTNELLFSKMRHYFSSLKPHIGLSEIKITDALSHL